MHRKDRFGTLSVAPSVARCCAIGAVDAFDLAIMLGAWCSAVNDPNPPSPPCENCFPENPAFADISGPANAPDGCVDAFDLAKLLAAWGPCR